MLRKVIIIRHGVYDSSTARLNTIGIRQMEELVPKIQEHLVGEENILLVSSPAPRAEDSVKVLAEKLNLSYQTHEYFWSDKHHSQNNDRALECLKNMAEEKKASVAVLVTHLEYAEDLPLHIGKDAGKQFVRPREIDKSEMVFLDMENEQCIFS